MQRAVVCHRLASSPFEFVLLVLEKKMQVLRLLLLLLFTCIVAIHARVEDVSAQSELMDSDDETPSLLDFDKHGKVVSEDGEHEYGAEGQKAPKKSKKPKEPKKEKKEKKGKKKSSKKPKKVVEVDEE